MSVPEGYELLARIGFVDKGNYSASATYLAGDVVYYNGSTWTALKDNLKGVTPAAGANWKYMARGFAAELLSAVTATDTSGLVGAAGTSVGAQTLMDKVAEIIATQVMMKSDLVSQIVNDATKAASMAALYSVKQQLDEVNSEFVWENIKKIRLGGGSSAVFVDLYGSDTTFVRLNIGNTNTNKSIKVQTYNGDALSTLYTISADA